MSLLPSKKMKSHNDMLDYPSDDDGLVDLGNDDDDEAI